VGPVFSFDVGVVVFLIFPGACELDWFFTFEEVVEEKAVKELPAVIKVDAEDGERQGIFHIFDFSSNFAESFAVGGTLFSPSGGDVDGIGSEGVVAVYRASTVSDGVGFKESGSEFVPLSCFDGDVVFEKESWFCGAPSFASIEVFNGF